MFYFVTCKNSEKQNKLIRKKLIFIIVVVVVLVFYGPSKLFRSFWARSVNLSTLGKPPRQFTST